MREIGPGDLLRQLLSAGAEFIATFQVTEAGGKAELGSEAIPLDVRGAFPGDTLTIRFDAHGTRDAEVVDRDGVECIELWAAFYSTLGGERFLSIPVDRLVGLADMRNTPAPTPPTPPTSRDSKAAPARAAKAQASPMQPVPRHAARPQAKLVEPPDDIDPDTDPDADPSPESPSPESKKSRAERAGFRVIRGGAA